MPLGFFQNFKNRRGVLHDVAEEVFQIRVCVIVDDFIAQFCHQPHLFAGGDQPAFLSTQHDIQQTSTGFQLKRIKGPEHFADQAVMVRA